MKRYVLPAVSVGLLAAAAGAQTGYRTTLLVANFGDGTIAAYDLGTARFIEDFFDFLAVFFACS